MRRLAGFEQRRGQPFPLLTDPDDNRAQLATLEADLAATAESRLPRAARLPALSAFLPRLRRKRL